MDNVVHNGEHSVTFVNEAGERRNTWLDWGLIPSSRPSEPVNPVWNKFVAINGINGQEDLIRMYPTSSVNSYSKLRASVLNDNREYIKSYYGYDIFQASSGSLAFVIGDQEVSFFAKEQMILNFLHNQKMTMTFMDDTSKTYTVRTTVDSFTNGKNYSSLVISYTVLSET